VVHTASCVRAWKLPILSGRVCAHPPRKARRYGVQRRREHCALH
jgi:hypothetical protein